MVARRREVFGLVVAIAAVVLIAGAGCSKDDPDDTATTTAAVSVEPATSAPPTTKPRTTSKLLTDVNQVLNIDPRFAAANQEHTDVIEAFVRAQQASILSGLAPPDPDLPELLANITGRQLTGARADFTDLLPKGQAYSEPTIFTITVGKIEKKSPTRYSVESCDVLDSHPYEIATGKLVEKKGPYAVHFLSELELVDGAWKLELQGVKSTSQGVIGCVDGLSPP